MLYLFTRAGLVSHCGAIDEKRGGYARVSRIARKRLRARFIRTALTRGSRWTERSSYIEYSSFSRPP